MEWIAIILLWVIWSAMIGYVAEQKGREGVAWALLAVLCSPPFTVLCLIAAPDRR